MTIPTTNYGWEKPTPGADEDIWGDLLNTVFDDIDADLKSVQDSLPLQIPNPCTALFIGASNTLQNDYSVSGSKKSPNNKVRAYNQATATVGTATLGQVPFNTDTTHGVVNSKSFQIGKWAAVEKGVIFNIIQYGQPNTTLSQFLTVANGGPNDNTNLYDSSTPTAAGKYKVQNMVPDALTKFGVTKVNLVHVDTGGIDTLKGVLNIVAQIRALAKQLYAEPWASPEMVIIFSEMPPRGSYWDVTNAFKIVANSAEFPRVGLLSVDFITYITDEFPETGDVAHYTGQSCEDLAPRFWNEYAQLPRFNLGTAKNPNGGFGVILSAAPSDGTVPGESEAVPYVASCETDFQVFTCNTSRTVRPVSYIQLSAVNAPRNIRTIFHNYNATGAVLCLMAPRKPAITITNVIVSGGNNFVTVTYSSTPAAGNPVEGAGLYISGLTGGLADLNGKLFYSGNVTPSPDPDDYTGTFVLATYPGVYLDGAAWSGDAYAPGATFEGLLPLEDPRTGLDVPKVYLFRRETVMYERIGGSDNAAFRVTGFKVNPDFDTKYDPYNADNRVLNSDFRMLETNWHTGSRSIDTWKVGDINSGRFANARSMYLTDTSGFANPLYWNERIKVLEGDIVNLTFYVKSTVGDPIISSNRAVLQFFDKDGDEIATTLGVQDDTVRNAFKALTVSDVAPAGACYAGGYLNISMDAPGGTVTVSDAILAKETASIKQFATRQEFVDAVASGFSVAYGTTVTAEGFRYIRKANAFMIPDLQGYEPCAPAYLEHFGAIDFVDVSSRDAIAAAASSGLQVNIESNKRYLVSAPAIDFAAKTSFVGDETSVFEMDIATFTNKDRTQYMSDKGTMFRAINSNANSFKGFKIIPSVWEGGKIRFPILGVSKAVGQNVVINIGDYITMIDNGQFVTPYGLTGANEIDGDELAGQPNPCMFTVDNIDYDAQTFELANTDALTLTPWVDGGFIEPLRFLAPICIRDSYDFNVIDVNIRGFSVGYSVAIDSCYDFFVRPKTSDWYSNFCFQDPNTAQATGVCIDQTRIGDNNSHSWVAEGGYVRDLLKGECGSYSQDVPTSRRKQTDGIGVHSNDNAFVTGPGSYGRISGVMISGVDEAVDTFTSKLIIESNTLANLSAFCVKCIYGTSDLIISNNILGPSERSNIVVQAVSTTVSDVDSSNIKITDNIFKGLSSTVYGASQAGCITMGASGMSDSNRTWKNIVSEGNSFDPGPAGAFIIDMQTSNADGSFTSIGDNFLKKGTTGYIQRPATRALGIAAISLANPCVITIIPGTDPTLTQWFTNPGAVIALKGITGTTQLPDGLYKLGTALSGGQFTLANSAGVNIDSSTFSAYTGGGFVQMGSKISIEAPVNKTFVKAVMLTDFTMAAGTLSATFPFKAAVYDRRGELSAPDNGIKVQLPGFYRINLIARTTGNTPASATEETQLKVNTTGMGTALVTWAQVRDTEAFSYRTSGVIWCDENDIITTSIQFTANATGVTFSSSQLYTTLTVEML